MWSTREQLAGLRVMRRTADGSLAPAQGGTPAVTEKGKGKLLVEWPMDDGRQLTILLSEEGMEIAAPGKGPDWMLELTAAPGAALPFTAFGAKRVTAAQKGFAYAFDCTKGTIATDGTSAGSIFVLYPSDGKLSLKSKYRRNGFTAGGLPRNRGRPPVFKTTPELRYSRKFSLALRHGSRH